MSVMLNTQIWNSLPFPTNSVTFCWREMPFHVSVVKYYTTDGFCSQQASSIFFQITSEKCIVDFSCTDYDK